MTNESPPVLFKRVLFFTKVIMTFLVISLVLVFNYLDYRDLMRSADDLNLINKACDLTSQDISDAALQNAISTWVVAADKPSARAYYQARVDLAGLLKNNGLTSAELYRSKSNDNEKKAFATIEIEPSAQEAKTGVSQTDKSTLSVSEAINLFRLLAGPLHINVLMSVDTAAFSGKKGAIKGLLDNSNEGPQPVMTNSGSPFFRRYSFQGVKYKSDSVQITFEENLGAEQNLPEISTLSLPATHKHYTAPGILYFAGFDSASVNMLFNNKTALDHISSFYGRQPIDKINDLFIKQLERNSASVAILGFDISRKWFPLSMLILLAMINALICRNILLCAKNRVPIISGNTSDDPMELLVTAKWVRFVLWILAAPIIAAAILFTSMISYSFLYYFLLVAALIVSLVLGSMAYAKSTAL